LLFFSIVIASIGFLSLSLISRLDSTTYAFDTATLLRVLDLSSAEGGPPHHVEWAFRPRDECLLVRVDVCGRWDMGLAAQHFLVAQPAGPELRDYALERYENCAISHGRNTDLSGMGNRFSSMVGYKALITAHGVLAAITFLFVVPGAIFMARFYHRNPRTALRFHIWLQILAVLLSTAAIVLAFQAVGRERSLTNPHHGIGVALYTLVMVQALGGSVIHRLEKGKERFKIPLKLYVCVQCRPVPHRLTYLDPSMARASDCTARYCPSSSRIDSVRLAVGSVHTVRYMGLHPIGPLLRPLVQEPA
jgi:hypothetical protein